jgi:chromosome segregation ATPase
MRAKSLDKADAMRKEAAQKDEAFEAYEHSQTDTELQAKVRAAMERYKQAVEDGIDPMRAKAAAERDIAAAMDSRYNAYLKELEKRGEALKNARQKELDAQNKVTQAQNNLAEAIQAQADNERNERRRNRDKKRDKLQDRLDKAQDRAENAPRRRDRKQAEREVKILQKRIAKIDKQNDKEDRQEEKRQSRQRRQQLQRNVDNARRQRNLAGSDADKARATRQQRQREQEAMRTPKGVRERLRDQAGGVIGQYGNLTAPGIGGNFAAIATAYTGQLDQLHRDLKDMQRKAYIVR